MTDREKLIELLKVPIYPHLDADPAEVVADYLLDNGVTFATDTDAPSKWISVEDGLPETNDTVLVLHKNRHVCTNAWLKKKWWIDYGRNPITHWMPLPEPPENNE